MGFLNPAPEDEYRIQTMGMQNPIGELPGPSALEGIGEAVQKGIAGGIVKASSAVGAVGDKIDSAADAYLPSWMASAVHYAPFNPNAVDNAVPDDIRKRNEGARDVVAKWAETGQDPRQTGAVGRIVSGTTEGLTVAAAGAPLGPIGAGTMLAGTMGHADYLKAKEEGLDDATAYERAAVTGSFAGLSAFVPAKIGSNLITSITGGAAANLALGAGQRGLTSAVLSANGYKDMADQYRIMDGEGMATDAILGSVFGGFGHITGGHRATPDEVDVAAATATDEHFARSAPGVPTTPEVANLHGAAMREAMDALAEGREPNTPADSAQRITDGIVPDPQHDSLPPTVEAAHAELPGFREAVDTVQSVEPVAHEPTETIPPPEPPLNAEGKPEGTAPPDFDTFTRDRVDALTRDFGDQPYTLEDGTQSTYKQVFENMQKELADVEPLSKAHEAAAACFSRTGGAA